MNVLRSRRVDPGDAEDLTQGFLLHFIQSKAAARAQPAKGRFRDFLVGALNHYLSDLQARSGALKRGGGAMALSLDERPLAEVEPLLPHQSALPRHCDRAWVASLIESVLADLEAQYTREGRGRMFRLLKPHLTGEEPQPYWKLALRLRCSPVALRKNVERMRAQFREKLRDDSGKRPN